MLRLDIRVHMWEHIYIQTMLMQHIALNIIFFLISYIFWLNDIIIELIISYLNNDVKCPHYTIRIANIEQLPFFSVYFKDTKYIY